MNGELSLISVKVKLVPLSRASREKKKKAVLRESKPHSCQPALYLMSFLEITCLIKRDIIAAQGFGMTVTRLYVSHISFTKT